MGKLNKYVVHLNVICYGESEMDAATYVEEALDNTSIVQEDGIIGVEIVYDDTELYDEESGYGTSESEVDESGDDT
jgi:hypothetical protein